MPLLMVLVASVGVRLTVIDTVLGRNAEGTGSFYGTIARNYLQRDNAPTLWAMVLSVGDGTGREPPTLYPHHPPAVPLLIAGSLGVFGDGAWQLRLPAALFLLGATAAIYVLMLPAGVGAAFCAATMLAMCPLAVRFGGMPDVINPQLVFFALLSVGAYLRYDRTGRQGDLGLLAAAFVGAAVTDWPAFYLVPVLAGHRLIAHGRRGLGGAAAIVAGGTVLFALLVVHLSLASHDWDVVPRQFLKRSTRAQLDDAAPFTWRTWLAGAMRYNLRHHTLPLLVGATGWITLHSWRRPVTSADLAARLLGVWAVLHVLVGRQGVLNHDWWWWPVTPFLCVATALLLADAFGRSMRGSLVTAALACVFALICVPPVVRDMRSAYWIRGNITDYGIDEIGAAIRSAAPRGRAVMLFERDEEPSLWYYADRPLIPEVWDMPTLTARAAGDEANLVYTFKQRLTAPPAGLVFPKLYEPKGAVFLRQLKARYPYRELEKFWVFDLTRPTAS